MILQPLYAFFSLHCVPSLYYHQEHKIQHLILQSSHPPTIYQDHSRNYDNTNATTPCRIMDKLDHFFKSCYYRQSYNISAIAFKGLI